MHFHTRSVFRTLNMHRWKGWNVHNPYRKSPESPLGNNCPFLLKLTAIAKSARQGILDLYLVFIE